MTLFARIVLPRPSGRLCLPHQSTLHNLASPLSVYTNNGSISQYLRLKEDKLTELEKIVAVQMDEIYVKSAITYSGGRLLGNADNSKEAATTIEAFLISSVFGSYQEVIELSPMNKMTSQDLRLKLLECIQFVQSCGFTVVAVIADNSAVNRKVYTDLLKPGHIFIENPDSADKQIFLLHDSVHLLKCIWKNWINQKDTDQIFKYPSLTGPVLNDCDATDITAEAKFSHLRNCISNESENGDGLVTDAVQMDVNTVLFHINPNDCELLVSEGTEQSLVYIAGFVSSKLNRKIQCAACKALLKMDRPLTCDVDSHAMSTDYIQLLDRGGLKYPSKFIILLTFVAYAAMQKLISSELEAKFRACKHHKKVLTHIMTNSLQEYFTDETGGVCAEGCSKADIISKALKHIN